MGEGHICHCIHRGQSSIKLSSLSSFIYKSNQVIRIGGKCLYLHHHLPGPLFYVNYYYYILVLVYVWVHAHVWRLKLVLFPEDLAASPFPPLSHCSSPRLWCLEGPWITLVRNDSKHVFVPRGRRSLQNSGCISSLSNSICPLWKCYYKHIPYS